MKQPLVRLVDRALPVSQFRHLRRAVEALGTERLRATYRTTFWFDFQTPPSNLVERAALALRSHLPPDVRRRVAGVEWWLSRMRTSNVGVDFHRDRDNALFDATGRSRHPVLATVLYLSTARGGLLAVTRDPPNPRNSALAPDRHDFDLVAPRPNRFVWFDGRLTHGVLDANNHIPGARLPREADLRLAIAINFWRRRPLQVPAFPDRGAYRSLVHPPRSRLRRKP